MTCYEACCNGSLNHPLDFQVRGMYVANMPQTASPSRPYRENQEPQTLDVGKPSADIRKSTSEQEVDRRMRSRGRTESREQRKLIAGRSLGEKT